MAMNESTLQTDVTSGKEAWVEPEIQQLNVSETAAQSGVGHDGGSQYADCTRS